MIVKVRFRGPIAARMPSDIYEIKTNANVSLNEALEILINERQEVRDVWASSEQMDRDTLLLRNEVDIGLLNGLETILDDGDELIVLPLVHGG